MATEENKPRPITAGEREMIEPLYKDSINYGDVHIFNGEYLPFGFQFDNYVMAPNGNIYFPEGLFREDFSSSDLIDKATFAHEMGHVWQHQMGVSVLFIPDTPLEMPFLIAEIFMHPTVCQDGSTRARDAKLLLVVRGIKQP